MKSQEKAQGKRPINPFADWGFKYTFGREENKDLLIGILNLLLEPEVAISDIRYLNTELLGDNPELKRCVVDVMATDGEGNRYLIEMQYAPDSTIRQRLVYYACRLIDQMGQHSKDWTYDRIRRVYAICLMDFTYERNATLREDYRLRNEKGDKLFSDLLTIIPLQLPCIKAKNMAECRKSYEVLLYLLDTMSKRMKTREELLAEIDTLDLPEQTLETFRRVVNTVEEDLTEDQWRDYELDLDKYQRTMGMSRTGREEGREEGRAEGRAEERQTIAKAMKDNGIDPEIIAKCCGLPKESVSEL
ncbi:MAG: Rpn family recombination-promoting nuclease/putative transposase [Bacteroidales bacterium]|nr:Rpn family recombination-promoting nuclease/putative transposase [Bacteroidales bacterium]